MATIKMGDIEIARTDEQLPITIDASLGAYRLPDGSIRYFESTLASPPYYFLFRGSAEDPFEKQEGVFEVAHNGYPDPFREWPRGVFVVGVAEHKGALIGVCHREHLLNWNDSSVWNEGAPNDMVYTIGLAISEDQGLHWEYRGDVCSNVINRMDGDGNMGGCPVLKVGPWLQFFFNDYNRDRTRHITAARCDLDECVDAMRAGKLPLVLKYSYDDKFESDAMLGVGTKIIPESDQPGYDTHACAAYCAPLGKYLMTVQTHWHGKLLMYQSDDAIHFDPEPIVVHDIGEGPVVQPYSTFVAITEDDSSADMTTIGREFYIYWPVKHLDHGYDCDTLYRRKFTVED